jgi:hypothetical protein
MLRRDLAICEDIADDLPQSLALSILPLWRRRG